MSLVTICAGVIAIILDQFGLIPSSIVNSVILAVLALLATSEIIEGRAKLAHIERRIDDVAEQIRSAQPAKVIKFGNPDEALEYLAKRTREATQSIDQASIDEQRSRDTPARQKYVQTRQDVILGDRIKFRYVAVLYKSNRLEESSMLTKGYKLNRYFSGFYVKSSPQMPMMNFNVFDKKEVFTRFPYKAGQDVSYIAIQSQEIAELFLGYFERLWEGSQKIETEEDYNHLLQSSVKNAQSQN